MAQINIYENCTDEKPVKTYTCRRILLGIAQKFADKVANMEGLNYGQQLEAIGEIVRIVFPDITDEELEHTDSMELQQFFKDLVALVNGKLSEAQKN